MNRDIRFGRPVSEPDHLADRAGGLQKGLVAVGRRGVHGLPDAVAQVVAEQPGRYLLQGPGGRGDLGNDIRAPGVGSIIFCRPRTWPSILRSRRR
jgi:hypothetical protein